MLSRSWSDGIIYAAFVHREDDHKVPGRGTCRAVQGRAGNVEISTMGRESMIARFGGDIFLLIFYWSSNFHTESFQSISTGRLSSSKVSYWESPSPPALKLLIRRRRLGPMNDGHQIRFLRKMWIAEKGTKVLINIFEVILRTPHTNLGMCIHILHISIPVCEWLWNIVNVCVCAVNICCS